MIIHDKCRRPAYSLALILLLGLISPHALAMCDPTADTPDDIGFGGGGGGGGSPCGLVGNPISIFSGNKVQRELDLAPRGPQGLALSRVYNSHDGLWRHSYSDRLRIGHAYVVYIQADGGEQQFLGSNLAPLYGAKGRLIHQGKRWFYENEKGDRLEFNTSGRMLRRQYNDGTVQTLQYDGNRITVSNAFGQQLHLQEGMLQQLSTARYANTQWNYSYAPDTERLLTVQRQIGSEAYTRTYHYEVASAQHLLTGITNESGVRFATWRYDEKLRAYSSEHAGGVERVTLEYPDANTTVVTSALGAKAVYSFREINHKPRITRVVGEPTANCPASDSSFEYDAQGRLTAHIHKNGSRTEYVHDERNLIVRQTDAAGTPEAVQTLTEWHPTLAKPVRITRPASVTTFTYDDHGRELSRSVSRG